GALTRKQMIADLTETSRALEARKQKINRVIEALKAEEDAATVEGEHNGQDQDMNADDALDGDTEELVEDSDDSPSN
ncbi:hypothetical protein A2U01_0091459, partial [Trifolium medium]|nr:hypothetical protein [Trifolium medium]